MTDTPAPDADPLQSPDAPGVRDDTAPEDPMAAGLRAARDKAPPGASDIAADDAGATAMAETMGGAVGTR